MTVGHVAGVAEKQPLVDEQRLNRAWSYICDRVPGLDAAFPACWVQPGKANGDGTHTVPVAVFSVHERNPRFPDHFQVSVTHMRADGWREMNVIAATQHPFANDVTKDPLVWTLFQAVKGHKHVMSELRAMSHPVQRFDGEGKPVEKR